MGGGELPQPGTDRHPRRTQHDERRRKIPQTTHPRTPRQASETPAITPNEHTRQRSRIRHTDPRSLPPPPQHIPPPNRTPTLTHTRQNTLIRSQTRAVPHPYSEPASPNTSTLNAEGMAAQRTKWASWLGESDPSGGVVGTFEGAAYYEYGIHRPTENSIMRSLNTDKFNLPGREAMIAGFYRFANALTPMVATSATASRFTRLSVSLADPGTGLARPELRWYVNGREAKQARGATSVLPAALGVPADKRTHKVTATVVDTTSAVRSAAVRDLTSNSVTWTVTR
ncbi:M64 family metallopeptidase [Streptomyces sp. NPDC000351]|uniref:M64 family metallopeptidase n=1 Tax=Streptomyces sp. NPDC000351 TaxID=3154250 RepID=UPI003317D0EA